MTIECVMFQQPIRSVDSDRLIYPRLMKLACIQQHPVVCFSEITTNLFYCSCCLFYKLTVIDIATTNCTQFQEVLEVAGDPDNVMTMEQPSFSFKIELI